MNFPFDREIILENSLALLRPLEISDVSSLLTIAIENEKLLQFSPMQIHSEELLRAYIEKATIDKQNNIRYPFIIFDKRKDTYAGSTSFMNISNIDKRLEIGSTWIGNGFQKTGLNRSCKYLLLCYAFDELGAERVEFKTDERNLASRNAIEKIGGQFEGILKSHTLMYDGFRRNTVCYSILKNDWINLKPNFIKSP